MVYGYEIQHENFMKKTKNRLRSFNEKMKSVIVVLDCDTV